jgi:beta-lactam-binding protein with PASTA domain
MFNKTAVLCSTLAAVSLLSLAADTAGSPTPQDRPSAPVTRATGRAGVGVSQRKPQQLPHVVCTRRVPDLSPYSYDSGRGVLAKNDLALGEVIPQPSKAAKGAILDQTPRPGTPVTCGTQVSIIVSSGPPIDGGGGPGRNGGRGGPARGEERGGSDRNGGGENIPPPCRVPELTGRVFDDVGAVQSLMRQLSWSIGKVERQQSPARPGTILKQWPQAGSEARCGSAINILVAEPIDTPPCQVPDVVGLDIERAIAIVNRAGFKVGNAVRRVASDRPGTVIAQSASRGARMTCGSTFDLAIAVPRDVPPCRVPDVVGRDFERAVAAVNGAGLAVGSVVRRQSKDDRPDTVIAQSAKAGALMACGSRFDLAVAVPPDPLPPPPPQVRYCPVPDVLGADLESARRALAAADLQTGAVDSQEFDRPSGTVLWQSLQPASRVVCRSFVNLRVSAGRTTCTVPNVGAADVDSARQMLAQRNLLLGTIGERNSERASGTILGQKPAAQTEVTCGTPVNVWVAVPMPLVPVPALQGQDATGARARLENEGLTLGALNRRPSEQSIGTVVGQLPAAGTQVQPGSAVQVWLSSGPVLRDVPDLRGRDRGTAAAQLGAAQFRLGDVFERAVDTTPGTIVDQQPAAGSSARPGTPVQVWVAVPVPIDVPAVLGKRESEASAILSGKRLRVGSIQMKESTQLRGTVIEQRPSPGQRVTADTPVDLVLAKPIVVSVPDLRGQDPRGAAAQLTGARLQAGESSEREAEGTAGLVIDQSPRPGERVEAGTSVQLVLSVPVRVAVPSVVGQTQTDAQALLQGRRLRAGAISTREASAAKGAVLAQRPAAGERVDVGTTVDLVLAVPMTVVVPDLRQGTRENAGSLLGARGLALGQVVERIGLEFPGRIVDQQPVPGTRVDAGAPVTITVAVAAPLPAIVPPVVTALSEAPGVAVAMPLAVPTPAPPVVPIAPEPATPVTPVTPWLWALLGTLVGGAAVGIGASVRKHLSRALPPSLTLAPRPDPRMAVRLAVDGPLSRAELWLKPCPDAGVQAAQGSGPFGMIEMTESR